MRWGKCRCLRHSLQREAGCTSKCHTFLELLPSVMAGVAVAILALAFRVELERAGKFCPPRRLLARPTTDSCVLNRPDGGSRGSRDFNA